MCSCKTQWTWLSFWPVWNFLINFFLFNSVVFCSYYENLHWCLVSFYWMKDLKAQNQKHTSHVVHVDETLGFTAFYMPAN